MLYDSPSLILTADSITDPNGTRTIDELPSPTPKHPLRLQGTTPLMEQLWRVALDDFADFATSMGGPDVSPGCNAFDADKDDDVDLSDYAEVQRLFGTMP